MTETIASLVSKSLLMFGPCGSAMSYHLLETIRAYALEMLAESGEGETMLDRHEQYVRTRDAAAHEPQTTTTRYAQTTVAIPDG